jgi:oligopeptidase B
MALPPETPPQPSSTDQPPLARREDSAVIITHGRLRRDPYAWLKDDNWREVMRDPSRLRSDIRSYLEAENAYTHRRLETPTADLQDRLVAEMKGRIKDNDSSVPAIDGPWAYYRRFREGGEYPVFVRCRAEHAFGAEGASEQLLIDGDELGKGRDYFDIRKVAHSIPCASARPPPARISKRSSRTPTASSSGPKTPLQSIGWRAMRMLAPSPSTVACSAPGKMN